MPKLNVSISDTNAVEIYYQTYGNPYASSKIIFISGLGAICSQWDYQVEYFSKQEDFHICVFDNRGSGFSDSPAGKYTTTMLADDALALINHLRWESVHIVGLSMGGMIAQELAYKLEKRVASLALLSTYSKFNGLPAFDNFKLSEPLKILGVIKQLASAPPARNTPEEFAAHTAEINFPEEWLNAYSKEIGKEHMTNRQVVIEWQAERFSKTGLQSPVGRAGQTNACLSHWMDKRLDVLAQYPYPKLVVAGDQDYILRQPASSLYLAKRLKAFLIVYPNGGHNIRVQDPEWLNEQLHIHLRKAKSTPKTYELIQSASCESFVTAEYDPEDERIYF